MHSFLASSTDFSLSVSMLTFSAQSTGSNHCFEVSAEDDTIFENEETVTLTLVVMNPTSGVNVGREMSQITLTITDNDSELPISFFMIIITSII